MNLRVPPLLCLAAALAGCGAEATPPERPNILLYVVDTLRADALAPYGNPSVDTPGLDALAAEGTLFERAFAPSSWTRPAMASMLTSTYPEVHGAVQRYDVLPGSSLLLSEVLQGHGYRTGLVTANPNIGSSFGFDQGFDDFVELYERRGTEFVEIHEIEATADDAAAAALAWIATGPEPWFLAVLSVDPHSPYAPPADFDRYGGDYAGRADGSHDFINRRDLTGPEKERVRSLYLAEVAYSDRALVGVLAALDAAGLTDRTVVAYSSDHGEEFWEHGVRGHGLSLSEASLHVPLVLRYPPRIAPGARVTDEVAVLDLFPTLLDLAGLPLPEGLDGRPLFAEHAGERAGERRLYATLDLGPTHHVAVRSGGWKLLWDRSTDRWALYDLGSADGERRDVSREHPEPFDELRRFARRRSQRNRELSRALHGESDALSPEALSARELEALEALGYTGDDE